MIRCLQVRTATGIVTSRLRTRIRMCRMRIMRTATEATLPDLTAAWVLPGFVSLSASAPP